MVSRLGGPRNSSHGWLPTCMGVSFGRCRLRPCFLMLRVGKHGDTPRMHTPDIALRCTVKRTAASIRRPLCFAKKQHSRGAKSAALPLTCCRAVASVALRLLARRGASPMMRTCIWQHWTCWQVLLMGWVPVLSRWLPAVPSPTCCWWRVAVSPLMCGRAPLLCWVTWPKHAPGDDEKRSIG